MSKTLLCVFHVSRVASLFYMMEHIDEGTSDKDVFIDKINAELTCEAAFFAGQLAEIPSIEIIDIEDAKKHAVLDNVESYVLWFKMKHGDKLFGNCQEAFVLARKCSKMNWKQMFTLINHDGNHLLDGDDSDVPDMERCTEEDGLANTWANQQEYNRSMLT